MAACAFLPLIASAQSMSLGLQQAPVQYTVTPPAPAPNSPVTIQAAGVGDFIGNSPITWTLDGTVAQTGTGDNIFNFSTGPLGKVITVGVTIESSSYGTIAQTWVFNPSLVNLVWEADTTIPPFYLGKALYSAGSQLTVFAFPEVIQNGMQVPASRLSFQWSRDGNAQVDASGLGRSSFTFMGNQLLQSETVDVDVLSGNTTVAHGEVAVSAVQPKLIFYLRDPLRGILYNAALPGTYTLAGQEVTVHAEPYFFSRTSAARGALRGRGRGLQYSAPTCRTPTR